MSQIKLENIRKAKNPIDVIEEVVLANGWEYDIDENRNIHVEIGGNWCDYQLSYGLNDKGNILEEINPSTKLTFYVKYGDIFIYFMIATIMLFMFNKVSYEDYV